MVQWQVVVAPSQFCSMEHPRTTLRTLSSSYDYTTRNATCLYNLSTQLENKFRNPCLWSFVVCCCPECRGAATRFAAPTSLLQYRRYIMHFVGTMCKHILWIDRSRGNSERNRHFWHWMWKEKSNHSFNVCLRPLAWDPRSLFLSPGTQLANNLVYDRTYGSVRLIT